jgi:hypothetical protein
VRGPGTTPRPRSSAYLILAIGYERPIISHTSSSINNRHPARLRLSLGLKRRRKVERNTGTSGGRRGDTFGGDPGHDDTSPAGAVSRKWFSAISYVSGGCETDKPANGGNRGSPGAASRQRWNVLQLAATAILMQVDTAVVKLVVSSRQHRWLRQATRYFRRVTTLSFYVPDGRAHARGVSELIWLTAICAKGRRRKREGGEERN